jgi:uncharacterized protein YejL (UPF0352 family)
MDKLCAPAKVFKNGSCISNKLIVDIVKSYNLHYPTDKILLNNNTEKLVKQLEYKLGNTCDDQICWLRQDFVKVLDNRKEITNSFRPTGPNVGIKWLNTTNINNVIKQYQEKYPDFLYLGAVPMDFDDLPIGIRKLKIDKLYDRGKTQIGIVFNTDTSDMPGEHWISLYCNLKKYQIYYFDSAMNWENKQKNHQLPKLIDERVKKLINRMIKAMYKHKYNEDINITNISKNIHSAYKNNNIINDKDKLYIDRLKHDFDIRCNTKKHQFKGTECGVYSIHFIINLVSDKSFDKIAENIKRDDVINDCRQEYFRSI